MVIANWTRESRLFRNECAMCRCGASESGEVRGKRMAARCLRVLPERTRRTSRSCPLPASGDWPSQLNNLIERTMLTPRPPWLPSQSGRGRPRCHSLGGAVLRNRGRFSVRVLRRGRTLSSRTFFLLRLITLFLPMTSYVVQILISSAPALPTQKKNRITTDFVAYWVLDRPLANIVPFKTQTLCFKLKYLL